MFIKRFAKKCISENYKNCHQRRTTCTFLYIQKVKKMPNVYIYIKSQTLFKNQDNFRYVLYIKSYKLHVTQFFMKILKLAFINKKHDTLRYVTFLYTKRQTLHKKQDNLRYVFIYKIWTVCVSQFFIEFLKLAERGHIFILKKQ